MKRLLILLVIITLAFTACSKKSTPEGSVKSFLTALSQKNYKEADSYLVNKIFDDLSPAELNSFGVYYESIEIEKIELLEKSGEDAVVLATTTALDLGRAFEIVIEIAANIPEEERSKEKIDELFANALKSDDVGKVKEEIKYSLKLVGNKWMIVEEISEVPQEGYEFIDEGDMEGVFIEKDEMADLCLFKINDEIEYIVCSPDQSELLNAKYKDKNVKIKYNAYAHGDYVFYTIIDIIE